jgi:transposase
MIPAGVQVFVALEPVDMRYGFERLSGMVRERMGYEPQSGALFVFVGRRKQTVKILFTDATGRCVFAKRLDKGVFSLPAAPAASCRLRRRRRRARRVDAYTDGEKKLEPHSTRVTCVHTEMGVQDATSADPKGEGERLVALASENVALRDALARAEGALANLRARYLQLLEELHLLKRRLVVAKAERLDDVADAQLAFDELLTEAKALEKLLDEAQAKEEEEAPAPPSGDDSPKSRTKTKPTGRRDLAECDLPEVRVEITDPELEGKVPRIGVEVSSRVAYQRGGRRRLVVTRIVYKDVVEPKTESNGQSEGRSAAARAEPTYRIVTAPMPKEIMPRGMLAPSMIAHVLAMKYVLGVPFHRYEQETAREGFRIDRGTMCRYAEHVGATLGCIVEAARKEAIATAFCLSTDATGVAIQPTRIEGKRQPCRKGHFFVTLADKDHVFLDFQPKHTSLTVWEMFKGFHGYVQADAHVIYDALFKGIPPDGAEEKPGECGPPPIEVGCLAHSRRKYWEAAVCKHPLGLEGVRRIDAIFDAERPLAKLAPAQRKARRDETVRPLVDEFFAWARDEFAKVHERGLVASALGYSVRHEQALRRFLDDGRLRIDNNSAERALRTIAVGRKAWMFYGSDDHAGAAGNILSLVASCKLHELDPELYLSEIIRILPYWPRDRYLELAPKYWPATRARLSPKELDMPLGHITVPPPLPPTAKEQASTD